jgi:SAM-dependent methyltransferase
MPLAEHDIRANVRTLYETLPYPPPQTDLDAYRDGRRTVQESPSAYFHLYWPRQTRRADLDILVAGCGTSQAAKLALLEPDARVTGIDLCGASLAHTRSLVERYAIGNLELVEMPLESAGELGRTFDLVVSTGVLHHLPDPDAGLRALRGVVAPGGAMHVMVYATFGRAGVEMMQAYCRSLALGTDGNDLRELAALVTRLASDHPLRMFDRRTGDLAHAAGVADALLHPQDRSYTVPELHAWLERCGVRFHRWFLQAPYLPQAGTLAPASHRARLADRPVAEQHAAMELLRGTMIRHAFVAHRDDETHPLPDLDDDALVPTGFQGATVRQEHLPPGAVAVLRHAGNEDEDLEVALDASEARVYQAIDGRRTIGEVAATVGADVATVRGLVRRLWEHDVVLVRAATS